MGITACCILLVISTMELTPVTAQTLPRFVRKVEVDTPKKQVPTLQTTTNEKPKPVTIQPNKNTSKPKTRTRPKFVNGHSRRQNSQYQRVRGTNSPNLRYCCGPSGYCKPCKDQSIPAQTGTVALPLWIQQLYGK